MEPIIDNVNPGVKQLPGQLIRCTYDGLPFEYTEWDDLYVVGDIPPGIWDKIRKEQEDYMQDPDWESDDLIEITFMLLSKHIGCEVSVFPAGQIPALRNVLCDFSRVRLPNGDQIVLYDEGVFCTNPACFKPLT